MYNKCKHLLDYLTKSEKYLKEKTAPLSIIAQKALKIDVSKAF